MNKELLIFNSGAMLPYAGSFPTHRKLLKHLDSICEQPFR